MFETLFGGGGWLVTRPKRRWTHIGSFDPVLMNSLMHCPGDRGSDRLLLSLGCLPAAVAGLHMLDLVWNNGGPAAPRSAHEHHRSVCVRRPRQVEHQDRG